MKIKKELKMKIRIATKDNMKADICDECRVAILKGEEYIIQYASWTSEGKVERIAFKLHKRCSYPVYK